MSKKITEQNNNRRRLHILKKLYEMDFIHKKDLPDIYKTGKFEYSIDIMRIANKDIDYFKNEVPFVAVVEKGDKKNKEVGLQWVAKVDRCWRDAKDVCEKLHHWRSSSSTLPDIVLDVLNELNTKSLLVGKGTTCYMVVKSIFDLGLNFDLICTANLLVICEAFQQNTQPNIWIPEGTIDRNLAYLQGKAVEGLQQRVVDTSVTSFVGLNYNDSKKVVQFYAKSDTEILDKKMNLKPHPNCENIVIALGHEKIGKGGAVVANTQDDFGDKRRYILVTDIPERDSANNKLESKWKILDELMKLPNVKVRISSGYVKSNKWAVSESGEESV